MLSKMFKYNTFFWVNRSEGRGILYYNFFMWI